METPRNSGKLPGIPWTSIEWHGRPWNDMEACGTWKNPMEGSRIE